MTLVGFPSATIAVQRSIFNFGPTIGTNKHPVIRCIMHDTVQRSANYLTLRASFDTGSGRLAHCMIISA